MELKRAAAFVLSAAMLLQPMSASAATWGSVVSAIRNYDRVAGGAKKVSDDENLTIEIDQNGELTISGGQIDDCVMIGGNPLPMYKFTDTIYSLVFKGVHILQGERGLGMYVDNGPTDVNIISVSLDENTTVQGRVQINAFHDLEFTNEGQLAGDAEINALDGASVTAENAGSIGGDFRSSAQDEGSSAQVKNAKDGVIDGAMNVFASGGAQMTASNEGKANEMLANAMTGGQTSATNDGDVSLRTSGWSKGDGSKLEITNNGNSGTMSGEAYLDGAASVTNNGTADGGIGGYTDGGRVDVANNGVVDGNVVVGAEKDGHVSAKNGEQGSIFGDLKGWTDGVGSTAVLDNSGNLGGRMDLESEAATLEANGLMAISDGQQEEEVGVWGDGKPHHDRADVAESVSDPNTAPGTAGEGVLSGERRGSGTVVVKDHTNGSAQVNGKKVDATLSITSKTTQVQLQAQLSALNIWNTPGEYTILVECTNDDDTVSYEAMTIRVADEEPDEEPKAEESAVEFEVPLAEQMRHEMEEQRKDEAIGGVFGSPYWIKQMYLGYHSYNLRLYIDGEQANVRERLSWNADKTKAISFTVNTVNPEKLTMRFDERVLEVFERTEITTVTLLDKNGAPVMQYNVSDLRAAYDGFGLNDADQLVVGGMDDEVMKIGADGQLVAAEE